MTNLINSEDLKELLIKNLPARIKAGNEKYNSNINEFSSNDALKNCRFINFNSKERISIMVFDMDKYSNTTALEYFKDIDGFLYYIYEIVGLEPTYICQTTKGFQFGYHLKNHIFTHQKKALEYLKAIKQAITLKGQLDARASNRLYRVWRNPLKHEYYYSEQINYELKDFKHLLPKRDFSKSKKINNQFIQKNLEKGNRNDGLFRNGMRYAKNQTELSINNIYEFLSQINSNILEPLDDEEVLKISNSVFNYWQNNLINKNFGVVEKEKDINDGAMELPKISGLSYAEYLEETKQRQALSAKRTVEIRDKEKNKEQLKTARENYISKKYEEYEKKIKKALEEFKKKNWKINVLSISKYTGIDRRAVKKLNVWSM